MERHSLADKSSPRRRWPRGFTLVEAVMVLGVLGVMAGIVISQINPNPYDAASEAAELKTALRFAQSLAFAQAYLGTADQVTWGIDVGTNSYQLVRDNNPQTDVRLPGQTSAVYTLPGGVTMSNVTVLFNFRGIPVQAGGAAETSDEAITVNAGGDSSTVTVIQQTGFLQ